MSQISLAYVPCPSHEEALRIGRELLTKKLIACANIYPITSIYMWEGEMQEEGEVVLLAKTTAEQFASVRTEIEKTHPYDVPCVLRLSGEANEKYFEWLRDEVRGGHA